MNENHQIDPYKYGKLVATVESLEKKVDKLEAGMEELLALANKGRGGFWMGMTIASIVGGVVTFVTSHWTLK